ncbi:MAG: hypothetical protein FJ224_11855 [Lentisphaerae bacterium]|nr:hypothetical protein [Lentisphaerota bacterium]
MQQIKMFKRVRTSGATGLALAPVAALLLAGLAQAGWHDTTDTVTIANVKATPRDDKTATLSFDLSWGRSFRHELNHDAVWVFFKVKPEGAAEWRHVRLVADKVLNPTGYTQGAGTPVEFLVPDGLPAEAASAKEGEEGSLGVFIRRAEFGQGTVNAINLTVLCDLTSKELQPTSPLICATGIEMVYIPKGSFLLGLDAADADAFFQYVDASSEGEPYRVTGPGAIPTGKQKGKLWSAGTAAPLEDGGEIPAAYPKGYAAFYCMKTMVKRGHYGNFLITIPEAESQKYTPPDAKHEYTMPANMPAGNLTFQKGGRKEGYEHLRHEEDDSRWPLVAAFAAWAGLRPMTEMEYEKFSRGPIDEGWETGNHGISHNSYWGAYDANRWKSASERVVTAGNDKGRSFKGTHGNGTTVIPADWPQDDAVGVGTRGGHEYRNPSCRSAAAELVVRGPKWRGVRNAPKEAGQ